MVIAEKIAKSILSSSKIYDYVINPYVGCQHACAYCYAKFMKRFTGHTEPWGEFLDVKINAPELLKKEIVRKKQGTIWISGVCDLKKYGWTDKCTDRYFTETGRALADDFQAKGIACRIVYLNCKF
jgi:DNA repair photolyase